MRITCSLNNFYQSPRLYTGLDLNYSKFELEDFSCFTKRLLQAAERLQVLNIRYYENGNEIVEYLCAAIPKLTNLYRLDLANSNIDAERAKKLAEALCKSSASRDPPLTIKLDNNQIGDEGAAAFHEVINTGRPLNLNLNNNQISDEGVIRLFNNASSSKLASLFLGENSIGDKGVKAICDFFSNHASPEWISLNNNNIGDEGAGYIAKAIRRIKHGSNVLQKICLDNNEIGDDGAVDLADSCNHNGPEVLKLAHNKIGNTGAVGFALSITNDSKLKLLDLGHNQIGDDGAKMLKNLIAGQGHLSLFMSAHSISNISENTSDSICGPTKYLYLEYNYISEGVVKELKSAATKWCIEIHKQNPAKTQINGSIIIKDNWEGEGYDKGKDKSDSDDKKNNKTDSEGEDKDEVLELCTLAGEGVLVSESWYGEVEEKPASSNNDQETTKSDNNIEANQVLASQTIDQDYDPNGSNNDRSDDHHQLSKEEGVSLAGETDVVSTTAEDGGNCVIM